MPMQEDERRRLVGEWLGEVLGAAGAPIEPASSDASFRRYFRTTVRGTRYIIMDAPPDKEDCAPFIAVSEAFSARGLNVPRVLASDLRRGLLLLTDLGTRTYLRVLNEDNCERLYRDALEALLLLQRGPAAQHALPPYDRPLLLKEMALFRDWLLARHLGVTVSEAMARTLEHSFAHLARAALEQPRVWVHRDYHSRNLMVTDSGNPGVLDFQDAVVGPVTYDLVSLLRDCYIRWPAARVEAWMAGHHARLRDAGVLDPAVDLDRFRSWFDLMGVQRHLKAAGIFARLYHRDHKPGYLADIPRTLDYVREVCRRTPALDGLGELLERWVPA